MQRDVFISYSRRNYDAVMAIKKEIDSVVGTECWIDLNGIESGSERFETDIIGGINACQVFLFMLSGESQQSEYALLELNFAKSKGKRIVLVNIDDCKMTDAFFFKYSLTDTIAWNNQPQHDKLLRDLQRWLGKSEEQPKQTATPPPAAPVIKDKVFKIDSVDFKMVYVEGGTFMMGATPEQGSNASDDEKPVHQVTLSDYFIGETPVTQALWRAVMGNNPSKFKGDNNPVERVSWDDCQEFVKRLSQRSGYNFRLPTEAEWEYAARSGRKSKGYKFSGSNDRDEVAWFSGNSGTMTHPVKGKKANELGMYDMSGNVWEWCNDWYGDYSGNSQTNPKGPSSGSYRVLRGGSWNNYARDCRVSRRSGNYPSARGNYSGFRLALSR